MKRQYLGCAGKVANGINTVHLAYVREHAGHALIGARQWIPAEQIEDPVTSPGHGPAAGPGVPHQGPAGHRHRRRGARRRHRLDFVCGDEVYGSCTELREFLEDRGQGYVLRVPSNFRLTLAGRAAR